MKENISPDRLEVAMHPTDTRRIGVDTRAPVSGAGPAKRAHGFARVTEAVRAGAVFVPFVKLEESAVNVLTNFGIRSGFQNPEHTMSAVQIESIPS
jgi:predicted molibdopterin-dependent oxidoreductase YjgC